MDRDRATPSTVASTPDVPEPGQKALLPGKAIAPDSPTRRLLDAGSKTSSPSRSAGRSSPSRKMGFGPSSRKNGAKARQTVRSKKTTDNLGEGGANAGPSKSEQLRNALAGTLVPDKAAIAAGSAANIIRVERKQRTLISRREPSERVGRCDRTLVWSACDTFWSFDIRRTGELTRTQYITQLKEVPTTERLRMLRKARLEVRFRSSAKPVRLDEFIQMLWPSISAEEFPQVMRWCRLREAWHILNQRLFDGNERDMRRVFEALVEAREDGGSRCRQPVDHVVEERRTEGELFARDLVRARILSLEEVKRLQKVTEMPTDISYEAYRSHLVPVLKATYVTMVKETDEERVIDSGLGGLLAKR